SPAAARLQQIGSHLAPHRGLQEAAWARASGAPAAPPPLDASTEAEESSVTEGTLEPETALAQVSCDRRFFGPLEDLRALAAELLTRLPQQRPEAPDAATTLLVARATLSLLAGRPEVADACVQALHDAGLQVPPDLHLWAARVGWKNTLLPALSSVSEEDRGKALVAAAFAGNREAVDALLAVGTPLEATWNRLYDHNAATAAAAGNHVDLLAHLRTLGMDLWRPLQRPAPEDDASFFDFDSEDFDSEDVDAVMAPASTQATFEEGHRAIYEACRQGSVDAVRYLLQDATPERLQKAGEEPCTLLEVALQGRHADVARALVEHAPTLATTHQSDGTLTTGILFASDDKKAGEPVAALLRCLIGQYGISVNAADGRGRTALHLAAAAGDTVACRALIDLGADLYAVDHGGQTAAEIAANEARGAVLRDLLDHMPGFDSSVLVRDAKVRCARQVLERELPLFLYRVVRANADVFQGDTLSAKLETARTLWHAEDLHDAMTAVYVQNTSAAVLEGWRHAPAEVYEARAKINA
ncbi:MAG TPA: ankyrin repeat domain-containing protein, partial [Myxococcota bacterium]|nr:ankyrin repeat domain-containing protein [Myxococcota bacterium]